MAVTVGTARGAGLRVAATVFTVAVLLHNLDHLRRGGDSVSASVAIAGTLAILLEVAVVAVIFARHPSAPLAAAAAGVSLAIGYVVVHFTPSRSLLSDSFLGTGASPVSVAAAVLETAAALLLAVEGARALGAEGSAAAARAGTPTAATVVGALRHPVVAAMAGGNLLILVGTLLTR